MPIRFHCAHCGKTLSIGTRKAGNQAACPKCHAEVVVPTASSIASASELPWFVETPPAPLPSPTAITPLVTSLPSPPPPAPTATALDALRRLTLRPLLGFPRWSYHYQIAASAGMMLVLGMVAHFFFVGLQAQESEPGTTDVTPPVQVAQTRTTGTVAANRNQQATTAPAEKNDKKESPTPEKKDVQKPQVVEQPKAEIQNPVNNEVVQEEPKKPAEPVQVADKQEPQPPKFQVKRRTKSTDEDLRKQLVLAPEVALDTIPKATQILVGLAKQPSNRGKDLLPQLAMQRADLFGLPLKMGHECHTGKEPAEHLQALSRKLRGHIEAATPPATNGVVTDPRPDPAVLRQRLLNDAEKQAWLQAEAIPALLQLLMAENKSLRMVLVDVLAQIQGQDATRALAMRALVDLHPDVREAALLALRDRPPEDYEQLFLAGFRYPWPAVADHAAEGIVALGLGNLVPKLISLLDLPDPVAPFRMTSPNKKIMVVTREVVRINHLSNCLLCHAPSFERSDLVRGFVPTPGEALPAPVSTPRYYEGDRGNFARADITYLKQDFSVSQPVLNSGPWPGHQRFDYLVRYRQVPQQEMTAYQLKQKNGTLLYPQKEAVLYTLRTLTGQDAGQTAVAWLKKQLPKFAKLPTPPEEAAKLSTALVKAPADRQEELLAQYLKAEEPVHNLALAQAIPQLPKTVQKKTREVLIERLIRTPDDTLRQHLASAEREIRLATIVAIARAEIKPLVPDLIEQMADADKETTLKLRRTLEMLTGQTFGPTANANEAERSVSIALWRAWLKKYTPK